MCATIVCGKQTAFLDEQATRQGERPRAWIMTHPHTLKKAFRWRDAPSRVWHVIHRRVNSTCEQFSDFLIIVLMMSVHHLANAIWAGPHIRVGHNRVKRIGWSKSGSARVDTIRLNMGWLDWPGLIDLLQFGQTVGLIWFWADPSQLLLGSGLGSWVSAFNGSELNWV